MVSGTLLARLDLSKKRLLSPLYDDPSIFEQSLDWPGDFPGRLILALTSLYYAYKDNEKEQNEIKVRLDKLFSVIDQHLNKNHYFGDEFNKEHILEQQLAGNSWYFRGLVKYFKITQSPKILSYLNTITETFLIPLSYEYASYPVFAREEDNGGVGGHTVQDETGKWALSTDVGCAFILLDGYTNIYKITHNEALKEAIIRVIDKFQSIDYISLKCQTHATLSCTRAILRFYESTKERKYLDLATKVFDTYLNYGMTKDYQNFNWFGKQDSWTEPCCVIDSFILAKKFYEFYGDHKYLVLLNRIYANGFRTLQRDNGGAGCTTCTNEHNNELKCFMYEAWFCCSMRLGEGLYLASKSLMNNLIPGSINDDDLKIHFEPYLDNKLDIISSVHKAISIYVPKGFNIISSSVRFNLKDNVLFVDCIPNEKVSLTYELLPYEENGLYFIGDTLLTKKKVHTSKIYFINGEQYSILSNSVDYSENELKELVQYIK